MPHTKKILGIVSFRGTEPDALQDYLTNAYTAFVPWNTGGERVHGGFNKRMRDKCARFVNDLDVVTNMPPHIMGYRHVNDERFVGSNDPELLLSEPLIDHTPLRYAVLVWNAYVDSASA